MTDGLLFGQFRSLKSTATSRFGKLMLVLLGSLFSSIAPAQDPNDFNYLPTVPTEMAHEGLLLDIVRVGTRIVAVGERGYIVYSDDEGKTWAQSTVPVSQTLTAVTFGSDTTGWAVGHEGIILRTDDGGENWALQLTGYDASKQELVLGKRRLERARAAVEEARDSGAEDLEDLEYAVEDAEIALESIQTALDEGPSNPFLDVWFADDKTGVAVGSYGMIFRTLDGGATWEAWNEHISNPDGFHYYSLDSSADGTLILAGEQGLLYRSRDNGAEWERLTTPYAGSFFGVLAGGQGGNSYILIYGLRGNIFRSVDGGDSWSPVSTGSELALFGGTTLDDGAVLLVGNSGIVLRSTDGGTTFASHIRAERLPYSAVVENGNGNLVLAGRGGVEVVTADGKDTKGG